MQLFSINTHHGYLNTDITIEWLYGSPENDSYIIRYEYCDIPKTDNIGSVIPKGGNILFLSTHKKETFKAKCAGHCKFIAVADDYVQEEVVYIEDAIKLGGSRVKDAFIFDETPWTFVTTTDRLYIINRETGEERVEHGISPEIINKILYYGHFGKPCNYFLFQTKRDYAIFNVMTGKIVFRFVKHIYSNNHLVIYKDVDSVHVYDYISGKEIVNFCGQYSFGRRFYYVKDNKLYGLSLYSSGIHEFNYVGEVQEGDMLIGSGFLRLENDEAEKKRYIYLSLDGNGNSITKTEIVLPYYIESWIGEKSHYFQKAKETYIKFQEENRKLLSNYPNIKNLCFGIKISQKTDKREAGKHIISLYGEIVVFPAIKHSISFTLRGYSGETIDFANAFIEQESSCTNSDNINEPSKEKDYNFNKGEKVVGESASGNLAITKDGANLYIRDTCENTRELLFQDFYDSSHYKNAFFTSDGKNIVLQLSKTDIQILGIENLQSVQYNVEGFTVAKNEGFNGSKPEILIQSNRRPVWRDPITLGIISEEEMSDHVFMSPDRTLIADINPGYYYYNRLTDKEISDYEYSRLCTIYDWKQYPAPEENEKKIIIENREKLLSSYSREKLADHIIEKYTSINSMISKKRLKEIVDSEMERYVHKEKEFTPLFIDKMEYVACRNTKINEEYRILIGRNVWYLNYVSFSYDSHYLAFGAKMKKDLWRDTEEGVFVLYDMQNKEVRLRKDGDNLQAVWMAMFSKIGDVAFYDSSANAYLLKKDTNYDDLLKANGKSLLCFSPSGKYIAFSDQNYIDYAHHPNEKWGHQPSGNIYIYSVDNFSRCICQFNDLGEDGIEGVATKARSVSSAAFSQDEKKLMVVGNDGVVVIRNLHLEE